MKTNIIYNTSSENMPQIDDKSVKLVVTSPPYNINIQYGNKTSKGQIVSSKGAKYKDNLDEDTYRSMLSLVFNECKKKITDDGSIWINIKNRVDDGVIIPPFWIMDFFEDMYLKNIIIWNFDWGGSTNKRFAPRYEYVFWFVKDKKNYTFNLDDIKVPALNYRPDNLLVQFCILLNVQVIIFLKYKLFFLNISYPRNGIGSISLSFPNGTGERFKKKLPSGVSIL